METSDRIIIRDAQLHDIEEIARLERIVWGSLGTACYGENHVWSWMATHAAGLKIAERGGVAVGYHYCQVIDFSFDSINQFPNYDQLTDRGTTLTTHKSSGNALHGVTVCSTVSGAGRALTESIFNLAQQLQKRYVIGICRMAGLDSYIHQIKSTYPSNATDLDIAIWYARCIAVTQGAYIWPCTPKALEIKLPSPHPDPVISRQLRYHPDFGLAGIMADAMPDPQSRNFAAILVRDMNT